MTQPSVLVGRKVIQIAVAGTPEVPDTLVALCDDGSIWWRFLQGDDAWIRVDDVPGSPRRPAEPA